MPTLNRREFVITASAAACACAVCGETDLLAAPSKGAKVEVGTASDYPADGVSDRFLKSTKLLVVRSGSRIYAMNGVCTHKACVVKIKDGSIKCPCHGSQFSEQGTATDGPAKASLFRFRITQDDAGRLIVDKSKQFGEKQWDDAGAFVTVA